MGSENIGTCFVQLIFSEIICARSELGLDRDPVIGRVIPEGPIGLNWIIGQR